MSKKSGPGNEPDEGRSAGIYARVSPEWQDVPTLDEQKVALLRFAEQAGYDVVGQYVDGEEDTDC